jgi:hypothetical protein
MWYRKRHVVEKFRYHIGNTDGNTDVVSEKTDVVSEKTDVVLEFFRYVPFRYHIGNYF